VAAVPRMTRAGRDRSLTSIAAAAGVSVSTVSKVLNGRTDVASHTRERVAGILRTHGYRVQPRPGIGIVDLLIGGLDSPLSEELIRGTVGAAAEARLGVVVTWVTTPADFARWLALAARRGSDGVLSALYVPDEETRRRLAVAHIPLVVIDLPTEPGGVVVLPGPAGRLPQRAAAGRPAGGRGAGALRRAVRRSWPPACRPAARPGRPADGHHGRERRPGLSACCRRSASAGCARPPTSA
jgi:transcriptional regulator with XRE-family HTH domain